MSDFFKEEDVTAAKTAINEWLAKNKEAGAELMALWKVHYLKAGHKTLARELVKKGA